jgi:Na+-translocating ferredoxin:NAD+ oxidoreductase subunit B
VSTAVLTPQQHTLSQQLNDALPQTQCTRCGYPDCQTYAVAIALAEAPINRCPPGGDEGISRLAAITGSATLALDTTHGVEGPRLLAVIDEAACIGCTLCIKACPVDCIVGAPKVMHTVIAAQCTGCELCVPACPVDCISMPAVTGDLTGWQAWSPVQAQEARSRYEKHQVRVQRDKRENDERLAAKAQAKLADLGHYSSITDAAVLANKRAAIEAAIARAQARAFASIAIPAPAQSQEKQPP